MFEIQKIFLKCSLTILVTIIRSEIGAYVNYEKNNVIILLISSHKLYLGKDYAIYDVMTQEHVYE